MNENKPGNDSLSGPCHTTVIYDRFMTQKYRLSRHNPSEREFAPFGFEDFIASERPNDISEHQEQVVERVDPYISTFEALRRTMQIRN